MENKNKQTFNQKIGVPDEVILEFAKILSKITEPDEMRPPKLETKIDTQKEKKVGDK